MNTDHCEELLQAQLVKYPEVSLEYFISSLFLACAVHYMY